MEIVKCLYPECQETPACRGLCFTHYTSASRYVKAKRVTWEELEKQGKSAPTKNKKQTNKNWFLKPAQKP